MENKSIKISEQFYEDLMKKISTTTVGIILSHIEVLFGVNNDKANSLKSLIKNTIYQQFREMKSRIDAFQDGVESIKISQEPTSE